MVHFFRNLSLRTRITACFVLIVICVTSVSIFMSSKIIARAMLNEGLKQIRHNLQAADMIYASHLETVQKSIIAATQTERLVTALNPEDNGSLPGVLERLREENRLDFLTFIDAQNPRMLRALLSDFTQPGADQYPIRHYLKNALSGRAIAGTEILIKESLVREDRSLAEQARMAIVPGAISSSPRAEIEEGIVMIAAAPVETRSGFKGVLYGGILLNQDTVLVSRIHDFLFGSDAHTDSYSGTVSIFMKDVCIATNVLGSNGKREVGVRAQPEIQRMALSQGRSYYGRTDIGGSWYLTAGQPIRNQSGRVVGILYLGIPEDPLLDVHTSMTLTFLLVTGIGILIVPGITFFITHSLIRPPKKG